jgi:prolyl oligopeptidase
MKSLLLSGAALIAALLLADPALAQSGGTGDPYAALEQVDGAAALAQVRHWNDRSLAELEKQPGFETYRSRALALLSDRQKIAAPDQVLAGRVLNFWQDADHPRGLWRIASVESFIASKPEWRTLIDVGALGKTEGRSWAFKGATCLAPAYVRCMVALSDGGGDAVVEREYDLDRGSFVEGGFVVPEAKTSLAWDGPDALYVATDFGDGSKTDSGYARLVKRWTRGTPLASAALVAEGESADVSISARSAHDGKRSWAWVDRRTDFFHGTIRHVAADGRLVASPLPDDAEVNDVIDGRLIATLKSPWEGRPAGALVAYPIADLMNGRKPAIETVFVPTARQAIEEVETGGQLVWIKLLDDVSGKLVAVRRGGDGRWTVTTAALPDKATVHIRAVSGKDDRAFATVEAMLTPPALYVASPTGKAEVVQALKPRFDATGMTVEQRFAISGDGTRIPYFLVRKGGASGPVPALVHAYGGFEAAQTPVYLVNEPYRSGPAALFWVEEGNAYVLANIRGGGEYGPAWHQAALREKRQNAYDDLYAVAEDLVKAGISEKGRIAVSGRSNGGLMAGVAMTQRPDLFGAVVIGSPLLDMKRYSHLLAGASWMGEYGNPDVPADWSFISRYSPYQALKAGVKYPVPFLYTSTRDDRVHPGHARKFAAKMETIGAPFLYFEALEGGHAAGVEPKEDALRAALVTSYLNLQLPR